MSSQKTENGVKEISLESDIPNLVALKVSGKITVDQMTAFVHDIEQINKSGAKAKAYINLVSFDGIEQGVVLEKLSNMSTLWNGISKMAYILDSKWMSKAVHLIDAVTPMHIRSFSHVDEEKAKAWLISTDSDIGA